MIQGSHCVNVPGLNSAPEAAESLMRIKEWGLQSMSDQVLGQLRFHKSFSITFDFRPSRISDKGLRTILQLTDDKKRSKQRILTIWIQPESLDVSLRFETDGYRARPIRFEYDPLHLNEWNTFSLLQRFDASSGNFLFKVTINGKAYPTMQNPNPLEYPKMRVYNARHYTPVFGHMRHLIIKSW